jgi:ketosteroid isomerase-like protein
VSRLRDDWLRDFRQKDVDAAVAMYADDAAFLPPDGQAIVGRVAIRDLYRTVAATYNSELTLRSRRIESSGDLAYDSGDFSETLTTISNGTAQKFAGQYLMEFRRDPLGNWRIVEHVWTQVPEAHPLGVPAPGRGP